MGLSLAYQLSGSGHRVVVVDRPMSQTRASWAAAGLLPAADCEHAPDALERLRAYSRNILTHWCRQLQAETGLDPQLEGRGAIHLARTPGETAALEAAVIQWRDDGIQVQRLDEQRGIQLEPALRSGFERRIWQAAYFLPEESTLRPPRLLKALRLACSRRGVGWLDDEVQGWMIDRSRAGAQLSSGDMLRAESYCICSGAWSERHLRQCGLNTEVVPWRGQMLLFDLPGNDLRRVLYEGPNYIVPRNEGLVLAGSTMEDVGFCDERTEAARQRLRAFAIDLLPELSRAELVQHWSGFRPGTADGNPLLGRVEPLENVFVATGHFRNGIALAAGSAVVLDDLMHGRAPQIDVTEFRPNR